MKRFLTAVPIFISLLINANNPEKPVANHIDRRTASLNELIKKYSTQEIVLLNKNEQYVFELNNGQKRVIKLIGIQEHRDSVIQQMRKADVVISMDGKNILLECAPYVMPTEIFGVRIQADTTSGWGNIAKHVQFSIWDARDPIVNTDAFIFPVSDYMLFSHELQNYNEVIHVGDGDPGGQIWYHDYGIDLAGFDGAEVIISPVKGKVIGLWKPEGEACAVNIEDDNGFIWDIVHFDSIFPEIKIGVVVEKGQRLGMMGKKCYAGNFAHLHLGTYSNRQDLYKDERNKQLNLYPWIMTAYQAKYKKNLYAVAGPHQVALTGEDIFFNGSNSVCYNSLIVSYEWIFPDGQTVDRISAVKQFNQPGIYSISLRITDKQGNEDVAFCKVKIFTKGNPENQLPDIVASYTPTREIKINQDIRFQFWIKSSVPSETKKQLRIDFGDGMIINSYNPYAVITHKFVNKGIYIVTASVRIKNKPITKKMKVMVGM